MLFLIFISFVYYKSPYSGSWNGNKGYSRNDTFEVDALSLASRPSLSAGPGYPNRKYHQWTSGKDINDSFRLLIMIPIPFDILSGCFDANFMLAQNHSTRPQGSVTRTTKNPRAVLCPRRGPALGLHPGLHRTSGYLRTREVTLSSPFDCEFLASNDP